MSEVAEALKSEVEQVPRRYRSEPYPPELRTRLTREARRLLRQGWGAWRVARALGLDGATVERWCAEEPAGCLVPVEVVEHSAAPSMAPRGPVPGSLTFVADAGWRIEGLDLAGVVALLRVLG